MKKVLSFVLAMILLGAMAFAQQPVVAIFPFEDMSNVFKEDDAFFFYRQFSNEFTEKNAGRFTVVPRIAVDELIGTEMDFQLTRFSAEEKTAEMMHVHNATQILSGYIGRRGNGAIRITVSLFTYPQLGQLPGGFDVDVANANELLDIIPQLVERMQRNMAGGGTANQPNRTYQIGDYGPAGGIVFYDKGNFSNGWRYLEAAPAETEFNATWGANQHSVPGTSWIIGSGKRNTELIVERLGQLGETGKAAQLCASLDFDGYKDWFLPSKNELDLMYKNLKQKELGNFIDDSYWSSSSASTQHSPSSTGIGDAWEQYFGNGSQDFVSTGNRIFVRAIRAF